MKLKNGIESQLNELDSVNYYWCNNSQSGEKEREDGFIWSPVKNADESFNMAYQRMTEVKPGDIIFSYAKGQMQAIGVAKTSAYKSPKPHQSVGEYWSTDGWKIDVDFSALENKIKLKPFIEEFKHLLPVKYAPMNQMGNGNQGCYLSRISLELAAYLLNKLSITKIYDLDLNNDLSDIPETCKQVMTFQRIGQAAFKKSLIQVYQGCCPITGITEPSLLRGSHIKRWADSDNSERLDPHNGFLFAVHIDALFDRGLISIDDEGHIIWRDQNVYDLLLKMNIDTTAQIPLTPENKYYLVWHRKYLFKG